MRVPAACPYAVYPSRKGGPLPGKIRYSRGEVVRLESIEPAIPAENVRGHQVLRPGRHVERPHARDALVKIWPLNLISARRRLRMAPKTCSNLTRVGAHVAERTISKHRIVIRTF